MQKQNQSWPGRLGRFVPVYPRLLSAQPLFQLRFRVIPGNEEIPPPRWPSGLLSLWQNTDDKLVRAHTKKVPMTDRPKIPSRLISQSNQLGHTLSSLNTKCHNPRRHQDKHRLLDQLKSASQYARQTDAQALLSQNAHQSGKSQCREQSAESLNLPQLCAIPSVLWHQF